MSSSDEKSKAPKRRGPAKPSETPTLGKKAAPPFDPKAMKTVAMAGKVASPFDPPAPAAQGFGVEETSRGLRKVRETGSPVVLLEKTEIMSPEERAHGRRRPKNADSPSKIASSKIASSKIAKGDPPSKLEKAKAPPIDPAVMKTQLLDDAKRRPEKAPRYPGLLETTQPLSHAKGQRGARGGPPAGAPPDSSVEEGYRALARLKPAKGAPAGARAKRFDPGQMRTLPLPPAGSPKARKTAVGSLEPALAKTPPEPPELLARPPSAPKAAALAAAPGAGAAARDEVGRIATVGGGLDAAFARFLGLADAALNELSLLPE